MPLLLPTEEKLDGLELITCAHTLKELNLLVMKPRKLLTTSGTKWPGIRLETPELTSDCSMPHKDLHPPGPSADTHQLLSPAVNSQLTQFQASSCSPTSPSMLQSAIPLKPSRWPNLVTSYLSSASNGLIS